MNGQATSLLFEASGGWLKLNGRAKRSFCGAGAMAAFTASSNRSNSASLITLFEFGSAGFLTTTNVVNRFRILTFPKLPMHQCGLSLSFFLRTPRRKSQVELGQEFNNRLNRAYVGDARGASEATAHTPTRRPLGFRELAQGCSRRRRAGPRHDAEGLT